MLGQLPTRLEIKGYIYDINPDYRNILQIISALNDNELEDGEKVFILLRRLFSRFELIPKDDYADALKSALLFIDCNRESSGKPAPKVVDWEKDEQLIFAAVNKVAGSEVRTVDFMHWWTFLGYYQSVDRDDLFSFIVSIRQKKANGRKLEKYESEFYSANRTMCEINHVDKKKEAENYLAALYAELTNGGENDGGG